jgi:hypothetical protein
LQYQLWWKGRSSCPISLNRTFTTLPFTISQNPMILAKSRYRLYGYLLSSVDNLKNPCARICFSFAIARHTTIMSARRYRAGKFETHLIQEERNRNESDRKEAKCRASPACPTVSGIPSAVDSDCLPTPSLLYIADANKGKPAPKEDRMKSLPARTDAAYSGYASPK